jgi:hypothetical protein
MISARPFRLASLHLGDVVLAEWPRAGLLRPSVLRAGRLQVIQRRLLSTQRGVLTATDLASVDGALAAVLGLTDNWETGRHRPPRTHPPGIEVTSHEQHP